MFGFEAVSKKLLGKGVVGIDVAWARVGAPLSSAQLAA